MSYRAQGLLLSSRSFTGPGTPLFRLRQMLDMLSPVGLPKLTLLSDSDTHTHTHKLTVHVARHTHTKRGKPKLKLKNALEHAQMWWPFILFNKTICE